MSRIFTYKRSINAAEIFLADLELCGLNSWLMQKLGQTFARLSSVRCSTYNLRGTTILDLPKVKSTTFGLRSWRYAASKLWNALPDESRKIQTFTSFKNYLKTLDLTGLQRGEDLFLIIFQLVDYIIKFLYFNISLFLMITFYILYILVLNS